MISLAPTPTVHEDSPRFNQRLANLIAKRAYLRCFLEREGYAVYGCPMLIDNRRVIMRVVMRPLAMAAGTAAPAAERVAA